MNSIRGFVGHSIPDFGAHCCLAISVGLAGKQAVEFVKNKITGQKRPSPTRYRDLTISAVCLALFLANKYLSYTSSVPDTYIPPMPGFSISPLPDFSISPAPDFTITPVPDFSIPIGTGTPSKPWGCWLTGIVNVEHGFLTMGCTPAPGEPITNFAPSYGLGPNGSPVNWINGVKSLFGSFGDVLGGIEDDTYWLNRCIDHPENCAQSVFTITRDQALKALEYINSVRDACHAKDLNLCNYRVIGRNCVDFVTEVVQAAGIKENWFNNLKVSRDAFPSGENWQAWAYVALKTLGSVRLFWGR